MKLKELVDLYEKLKTVNTLGGVKFAYAIAKNRKKIESEIECIKNALIPSEGIKEFDLKRIELYKKLAEKDEKGNPIKIFEDGLERFKIKDEALLNQEIEKIKNEYKDAVEEREKQIKDSKELLEKEIDFQLFKIKKEEIPENITAIQLENIFDLIE